MTPDEAIKTLETIADELAKLNIPLPVSEQVWTSVEELRAIADVIRNLEAVRLAALLNLGTALDYPAMGQTRAYYLGRLHCILANNNPSGEFTGPTVNTAPQESCQCPEPNVVRVTDGFAKDADYCARCGWPVEKKT